MGHGQNVIGPLQPCLPRFTVDETVFMLWKIRFKRFLEHVGFFKVSLLSGNLRGSDVYFRGFAIGQRAQCRRYQGIDVNALGMRV